MCGLWVVPTAVVKSMEGSQKRKCNGSLPLYWDGIDWTAAMVRRWMAGHSQ
jgi:hypothetical protein